MTDTWIDTWLGAARFQKYVTTCHGDRAAALALYQWNADLGQALMKDIGFFEVALRNSYDAAISARWRGADHWLLDPESPAVLPIWRVKKERSGLRRGTDVNYPNRRAVDAAIRKAGGPHATPGKVIAELSFGFWRQLTSSSMEKVLWVPYVHHAYPAGTSRSDIDHVIADINTVRNRIAHHEPIFDRHRAPSQDPAFLHRELVRVLQMIAPEVAALLSRTTSVPTVLTQRP